VRIWVRIDFPHIFTSVRSTLPIWDSHVRFLYPTRLQRHLIVTSYILWFTLQCQVDCCKLFSLRGPSGVWVRREIAQVLNMTFRAFYLTSQCRIYTGKNWRCGCLKRKDTCFFLFLFSPSNKGISILLPPSTGYVKMYLIIGIPVDRYFWSLWRTLKDEINRNRYQTDKESSHFRDIIVNNEK
jgi:hypothetical protein